MLLAGEKPEKRLRQEGESSSINNVGDVATQYEVQLELVVVVALNLLKITRGVGQIQ